MLLDKILKIENHKKIQNKLENKLKFCSKCGRRMNDNTFRKGSRLAGSYDCICGNKIIF